MKSNATESNIENEVNNILVLGELIFERYGSDSSDLAKTPSVVNNVTKIVQHAFAKRNDEGVIIEIGFASFVFNRSIKLNPVNETWGTFERRVNSITLNWEDLETGRDSNTEAIEARVEEILLELEILESAIQD